MFDEASDINMHANLNVFVNVLMDDGTVRTLTLALVEIEAGDAGTISVLLLFVFTNRNHIGVLHTTSLFRHCIRYFNAGLTRVGARS